MPITDQPLTPGTVWQVCPVHPTTPLRTTTPSAYAWTWCLCCQVELQHAAARLSLPHPQHMEGD